ncbi:hypothetical protein DP939_43035 [Spongiactinospora rosea]|uniref:Uncharacterized protein n=1 Tax=Spongiactinospora rosea TaxID=2248750 RepID=A0A366LJC1_9ACTN|nr:hypothetical protein DP939_43035 [Spongiactinospora rosea]
MEIELGQGPRRVLDLHTTALVAVLTRGGTGSGDGGGGDGVVRVRVDDVLGALLGARDRNQAAAVMAHLPDRPATAAHAPQPVGDRLRARAAQLRGLAEDHDRTRITLQETTT